MAAHTGQPTRSRRFIKVYLSTWALLASGALAYLAVLTFPSHTAAPPPQARLDTPRETPRAGTTDVEVRAMKGSLNDIRKDVSQLQEAVGERVINEKVVQTRLSALEERVSTIDPQQSSDASPAPAPDNADKSAQTVVEPPFKPAPQPAAATPMATSPTATSAAAPIETGSIVPTPKVTVSAPRQEIVFGAPVVTRADAPELAVQLAASPSVQALKQSWGELSERHAEALSTLQPRVVPPRGKGRNYRLIAGPVATKVDAARICSQLGAGAHACFVTPYAGAPL
jgi:hypothetical protein